jgi:dUTP pyrophosphatase
MANGKRRFQYLPEYQHLNMPIPQRKTLRSAGYDIAAAFVNPYERRVISPGGIDLIPTGLTVYDMEDDDELQIRSRSGLAWKNGIIVANSPGTIDADYEGQHIQVLLHNVSDTDFVVTCGMRIAQGVFSKVHFTLLDCPDEVVRRGGFGHTGV